MFVSAFHMRRGNMEHGDDGRSRDDVMDGPASPPDESGRILDPFRKAFAALAAALFSVGYRPHPLDALRRPGKPMRWFLCLGCVLVLPVVTFYISALLVSLIPDTSENAGIAATDTFGEYVVMFIQIMGEACLSILLFALLYKASIGHGAGRIHGSVPSSRGWFRPFCSACCICLRIDGIFCNAWSSSSRCSWDSPRSSRRAAGRFCSFPISCTTCSAGPWC